VDRDRVGRCAQSYARSVASRTRGTARDKLAAASGCCLPGRVRRALMKLKHEREALGADHVIGCAAADLAHAREIGRARSAGFAANCAAAAHSGAGFRRAGHAVPARASRSERWAWFVRRYSFTRAARPTALRASSSATLTAAMWRSYDWRADSPNVNRPCLSNSRPST